MSFIVENSNHKPRFKYLDLSRFICAFVDISSEIILSGLLLMTFRLKQVQTRIKDINCLLTSIAWLHD